MIKDKFNPVVIMLISLTIWFIIMLLVIPGIFVLLGNSSISDLGWLFATLYLSPVVCIIVFNIALIRYRQWARKYIWLIIIINLSLIAWLINSIAAFTAHDISKLWLII